MDFASLSIAILSNTKVRNKLEWSHPQTKEGKISLVSLWLMPCMCVQRFVLRQVWAYHNRKKHNSKERWKLIFMMKYEKNGWNSLNFGWGCFYEELISDCEHLITLYLIWIAQSVSATEFRNGLIDLWPDNDGNRSNFSSTDSWIQQAMIKYLKRVNYYQKNEGLISIYIFFWSFNNAKMYPH